MPARSPVVQHVALAGTLLIVGSSVIATAVIAWQTSMHSDPGNVVTAAEAVLVRALMPLATWKALDEFGQLDPVGGRRRAIVWLAAFGYCVVFAIHGVTVANRFLDEGANTLGAVTFGGLAAAWAAAGVVVAETYRRAFHPVAPP